MKRLEVIESNGERRLYFMPDEFTIKDGDGFTRFKKMDGVIILQLPNTSAWCILEFLGKSQY